MSIRDLVPRLGNSRDRRPALRRERDPFREFQREMNRLFDDFFTGFDEPGFGLLTGPGARGGDLTASRSFSPRVDVTETDKEIKVTAELPGMDEKDVTVEVSDTALTVRGERQAEKENRESGWYTRELSYGAFNRVIPLPADVEAGKAKAKFRKGLLTVTVPKQEGERKSHRTVTIESD